MNRFAFLGLPWLLAASPAFASGSFDCRTIDGSEIGISGTYGHVIGSPIVSARLQLGNRTLSTSGDGAEIAIGRSWLDETELRLDLVDLQVTRFEAELRVRQDARRRSVGTLIRDRTTRRVRCTFD
jgi:hypothetical protein